MIRPTPPRRRLLALGVTILGLIAALSVWAVNGRALFYFDSAGYLETGDRILTRVGLAGGNAPLAPPVAQPDGTASNQPPPPPAAEAPTAGRTAETSVQAQTQVKTVVGNRSALYATLFALIVRAGSPEALVFVNLFLVWLSVWLLARVLLREAAREQPPHRITALGLSGLLMLAGSLGALPFYVAFLMPDILAPILILMLALLSVHLRALTWPERGTALLLAVAAVLSHPSHLLLAGLMIPLGALAAPQRGRSRLALALLLGAAIVGTGLAERWAYSSLAHRAEGARVILSPFLTARLIDDGPGLSYLRARCPDPDEPACPLQVQLDRPGALPLRFDAPVILFDTSPEFGSFQLLPELDRQQISLSQLRFAARVLWAEPGASLWAMAGNLWQQLIRTSVQMTIPDAGTIAFATQPNGPLPAAYGQGRLTAAPRDWLRPVEIAHAGLYLASLAAIAALLALRPAARAEARLTLMILAGIALNALVCGVLSEPADRYGARTLFLLPMLALLLACLPSRPRAKPPIASPSVPVYSAAQAISARGENHGP